MKGIILAAGRGTRLGAITTGIGGSGVGISKPLAPVFDKPTIYYPLTDLMSLGIRDILVIAAPDNVDQFRSLLGDGDNLGISISYAVQPVPRGIGEAFIIAEDFIGNDSVALAFGDNVFSGENFTRTLASCKEPVGANVFAIYVNDPENFGVATFDREGRVTSLEEKPTQPQSNYAVVGFYLYDNTVVQKAKQITPSARGELEITDINKLYLEEGTLHATVLDSDTHYFDTGNAEALFEATEHVRELQRRTNRPFGSPELIALTKGYITPFQFKELVSDTLRKSSYGKMLAKFITTD